MAHQTDIVENEKLFLKDKKIEFIDNNYYFECPHCKLIVQIAHNEVNCGIFRHGVYIETGQNIHPHASKDQCDMLLQTSKIYGCGKPFKFDTKNIETCDYI